MSAYSLGEQVGSMATGLLDRINAIQAGVSIIRRGRPIAVTSRVTEALIGGRWPTAPDGDARGR
ncbi:hypothetical protein [Euzebya pacifica]|uniref:hypothetical protein n=1 Tax=Euzebya pacifica TaxID=1608957 RepID=UPI0030FA85C3